MSVERPDQVAATQRRLHQHGAELVGYHRGAVERIDALLADPPPEHAHAVDELRGPILRERDRHLQLAQRIEALIARHDDQDPDPPDQQAPDQGEREEHHG